MHQRTFPVHLRGVTNRYFLLKKNYVWGNITIVLILLIFSRSMKNPRHPLSRNVVVGKTRTSKFGQRSIFPHNALFYQSRIRNLASRIWLNLLQNNILIQWSCLDWSYMKSNIATFSLMSPRIFLASSNGAPKLYICTRISLNLVWWSIYS